MIKRQYSMTRSDHAWVARVSMKLGISASEFVRRMVAEKRASMGGRG